MRHLRVRRRFKTILVALLFFTSILFFESRVESFAPQIKNMVEYKVGEAFGRNVKLSIGDMDGGVFRPFILNDVRLSGGKDPSILSSLEIKSIKSNLRIWDFLIKAKELKEILGMLDEQPSVYVDFVTKNKELSGYIKLEGDARSADVKGYVILFEKRRVDINGKIRAGSFFVELRPRSGALKVSGKMDRDGYFLTNVKAEHLKVNGIDIVCEAVLKNRIVRGDGNDSRPRLEGSAQTRSLVINYTLFPDVKASYNFIGGMAGLEKLEIGRELKAKGWVKLRDPYNMNIQLTADNANLVTVLSYFGVRGLDNVSCVINAKADLKGPARDLRSTIRVSARKGNLGALDFESIEGVIKGEGTVLRIDDSRITRKSGYFSVAGEVDLKKIGKTNVLKQLTINTDERSLNWDEWTSSAADGGQGLQKIEMKKKVFDDLSVGFKKFVPDTKVDESTRDRDQVELEYRLQANDSIKVRVDDDSNFVGLEHKDKF